MLCQRNSCIRKLFHSLQPRPVVACDGQVKVKPAVTDTDVTNFYKRKLPDTCIDFASEHGKRIFKRSFENGYMESYFKLSAQFHTQAEPLFCGLTSLVMVLNALAIDPGKIWKGVFRWYHEDMLDCCAPLDVVKKEGISADKLLCLALCNQLSGTFIHADKSSTSVEKFRETVKEFCSKDDRAIIVSYGRQVLNQTGSGHFSPIAGYDVESDRILIMDVARFKYPPYWVKTDLVYEAMRTIDTDTGLMRGYMLLYRPPSRKYQQPPLLFKWTSKFLNVFTTKERLSGFFDTISTFFKTEVPKDLTQDQIIEKIGLKVLRSSDAGMNNIMSLRFTLNQLKDEMPERYKAIKQLACALSSTKIFQVFIKTIPEEVNCDQKLFTLQADSCCSSNQTGTTGDDCVICVPHFLSVFMLSLPFNQLMDDIPSSTYAEYFHKFVKDELDVIQSNGFGCAGCPKTNKVARYDEDALDELHGKTLLWNEVEQIKAQLTNIILAAK